MFPLAMMIATIAMASGISGATFLAPLFILALSLPPEIAIGTGLITQVFGFASGVTAYARQGLIDYKLSRSLMVVSVPAAVLGTSLGGYVSPDLLRGLLGLGLIAIALSFLRSPDQARVPMSAEGDGDGTSITTREGEVVRYEAASPAGCAAVGGIGGLLIGMISTGQGELNGYYLLRRCSLPPRVAVASNVFAVAVTSLVASVGHFMRFVQTGGQTLDVVINLTIFTVPGVIIGGQLGPLISSRVSQSQLEKSMAALFGIVAILMLLF
jgi:hypothetical protein